VAIADGKMI